MGTTHSKPAEKANSFGSKADRSPQTDADAPPLAAPAQATPPTAFTRRSKTMPTLTPDAKMPQKEKAKPSLTIDPSKTVDNDGDAKASICGSPGWSAHKGKERKKAKKLLEEERKKQEKEKKEAEKKAKKEADKQDAAAKKAGKREGRLNKKPPPAAMETQRMPSELRRQQSESRRNSIISMFSSGASSNENSRRSSRDLKRLSAISAGSGEARRSRSTPGTSTEVDDHSAWPPSVTGVAPQLPALPRFDWRSRSGSSAGSKSNSWGSSDEAYNRNLVEYANQLNQHSASSSPRQPTFNQNSTLQPPRPLGRSHTDTALITVGQDERVIKEASRAAAERKGSDDSNGKQKSNKQGAHRSAKVSDAAQVADASPTNNSVTNGGRQATNLEKGTSAVHPLQANPMLMGPSVDGSSYVHKQRMYQQQRSVAGFQDEEAIRDATRSIDQEAELQREKEEVPVDGQKAEVVLHNAEEIPPVPRLPAVPSTVASNESMNHHHSYLRQPQDGESVVLFHPDNVPESKKHSFLGFPRRPKPAKQSSQTTSKSTSSTDAANATPRPSPRLDTQLAEQSHFRVSKAQHSPTHASKTERTLGERASTEAPISQTSTSRSKKSQIVADRERSPTGKSSSPIQGRSKLANAVVDKESPPRKTASPTRRNEASPGPKPPSTNQDDTLDGAQMKDGTLVRSHSRTRTSSSQLLNENVSMPRTLPRSTTAPVLPSFNMEPFDLADDESNPTGLHQPNEAQPTPYAENGTVQKRSPAAPTSNNASSANQKVPEVIISTAQPDGVVRKTFLKRPRSNPQLQVTPAPSVPNLDFLPQLKHQPLVKPKPRSQLRNSVLHMPQHPINPGEASSSSTTTRPSSSQFPVQAAPVVLVPPVKTKSAPNLATSLPPRSPLRPAPQGSGKALTGDTLVSQRSPMSKGRMSMALAGERQPFSELNKPIAKTFTMCCGCRYWHDLPSHLYEALVCPTQLKRESVVLAGAGGGSVSGGGGAEVVGGPDEKRPSGSKQPPQHQVEEATLDAVVQCPWCEHFMSRLCCASWTTIVYLHQKHH